MKNVITSPPLVRTVDGRYLRMSNGEAAICVEALSMLFEVPAAGKYYLLLSETKWSDGDCVRVWIKRHNMTFEWGTTPRTLDDFMNRAQRWLHKHLDMKPDTVHRYYLRLEYEE